MKFGFELEAFCLQNGEPRLVPSSLPYDECGWLVEIRSEPNTDITNAIYLLRAEQEKVENSACRLGVRLLYEPLYQISRDLKVKAARTYAKGPIKYSNLYGHETHRNSTKFQTASLHISFTNERTHHYTDKHGVQQVFKYPGFVDYAKIVMGFDKAFKEEIKAAKRNPGFYEVKSDGRIEYRSLPNNVCLDKVQTVLTELTKGM